MWTIKYTNTIFDNVICTSYYISSDVQTDLNICIKLCWICNASSSNSQEFLLKGTLLEVELTLNTLKLTRCPASLPSRRKTATYEQGVASATSSNTTAPTAVALWAPLQRRGRWGRKPPDRVEIFLSCSGSVIPWLRRWFHRGGLCTPCESWDISVENQTVK